MSQPTTDHLACAHCGFQLWHPVAALTACDAGLYDDGRFPGRLILSARTHFDHLDEMPAHQLAEVMADVQVASRVLRDLADVQRVNVAILGNCVPHVHAHLIPRRATDVNIGRAPWDGAPSRYGLGDDERARLTGLLIHGFDSHPV